MDFTQNLVLKENYAFFVADRSGMVEGGEHGLYQRDTRFLNRYCWRFSRSAQPLLTHSPRPDRFSAHYAVFDGPSQLIGIRRRLELGATLLGDTLELENTSLEVQHLTLTLEFGSDFADLFEARGWHEAEHQVTVELGGGGARLEYLAADGVRQGLTLSFSQAPERLSQREAVFALALEPKTRLALQVRAELHNPLEVSLSPIPYETWMARGPRVPDVMHQRVLTQATQDLRALLLFTEHGPLPAAGIPWFVTAFGRDALITAYLMLPHYPEVARGTLRYLAAHQGQRHDPYRAEAPGKILHEVRQGELSRTGKIPFDRYYGSIDATPLFLVLLFETWRVSGDDQLVRELRPAWEAALGWMEKDGDPDGDGFLEFVGSEAGKGLSVQSWKDSHDSLSHADGRLARGAIAVSEVQGYAYAAYLAAAAFYRMLDETVQAERWQARAHALRRRFHEAFWLEPLKSYALALDGDKRPLEVLASDAGQLLWSGIVPEAVAPILVETLFSDALFSGWGIRTLGANEARYNPLSYHNGSVWPHDTALIAGGLSRYGFVEEAITLKNALFDLAASQADLRAPELVAGYPRSDAPPVPYPVACRPQAWSAAALLYLAAFETG